jgi:pyruvate/2-oxoglutarate dehydrogenase complex dihydrolipoamide dehydrogenase (E3) component
VRTGAECIHFEPHAEGIVVGVECTSGDPEIVGTDVLLAVGRRPNTHDLGLEQAGVKTDARGYIQVDDSFATSTAGIWALGDCNGRRAFTHTALQRFRDCRGQPPLRRTGKVSERILGYALYIDPPLGRVGMTEIEARASGRKLLIGQMPMSRVGRAIERDNTHGFMKVIVDPGTKRIVGAAILGIGGDEAIHGILDIMNAGTYDVLRRAVPIHPTVSELIPRMLGEMTIAD